MISGMMGVSLLLLVAFSSSLAQQITRQRNPMYIVFRGTTPAKEFLTSTLALNPVYDCTKDLRKKYHPRSQDLNFDEFAEKYVNCYGEKILGRRPDWVSLYGNRNELKAHHFSGLRLNIAMNDVKFTKETPVSTNVDISLRNVVYNSDSRTEVTNKVQESVEKVTSVSMSSKHTWKTSGSVEVGFTEPITKSSASVKMSFFSGGSSGSDTSTSDSIKYFISDASTVPGGKTGRLIWTKTVSNTKMDWNAYIEVSGWMGAKINGNIHFFPAVDMMYVYDEYMTRLDLNTVGVMTSGEMQMTDALISDAVVDEYDTETAKTTQNKCPESFSNILMYPLRNTNATI